MKALERLEERIAGLIDQAERGEEIDWQTVQRLQVLDLVQAGVEFTRESIAAQEAADV